VHYDGSQWRVIPTQWQGIENLWGAGSELYVSSQSGFGRWNGTATESLIDASAGLQVTAFWGRSENEVFLAVTDPTFADYQCGQYFAVWFDGTKFHQF
jgi:hypothetical protein